MKDIIFLLLITLNVTTVIAQDDFAYKTPAILSVQDTILTQSDGLDFVFYEHILKPKQTLYSIAKYFGTSIYSLYQYNPQLSDQVPEIGAKIIIPFPTSYLKSRKPLFGKMALVFYKVKPKDNLFRISRVMFDLDKKWVSKKNKVEEKGLHTGDEIFLGWWDLDGVPPEEIDSQNVFAAERAYGKMASSFNNQKETLTLHTMKGMATWRKGDTGVNGFYIMHKSIPPGTIVEIENPMYHRKAYAKVVGKIPKHSYPNEVLAVVTPSLANYLGVMDTRFFVKMRYLQ